MTPRFFALTAASLAIFATLGAQAQGLSSPAAGPRAAAASPAVRLSAPVQRQADFIVAVVNSEPVTNHEVQADLQRVRQQLAQQRPTAPLPDNKELARQVLERLIIDLPSYPIVVDGDLVRLAQVFSNLLINAAKFSPEYEDITVSARKMGNAVNITVKDNGA